jgi:hypothetical protein
MDKALEVLQVIGGISSSSLALITFVGILLSKFGKGKTWVSKALGIIELKDKLSVHLASDEKNIKLQEMQSRAILSMLRNTLRHMCTEALKREYVTTNELETIMKAHYSYKEMHGNTFIDGMVERVKELPIENEKY